MNKNNLLTENKNKDRDLDKWWNKMNKIKLEIKNKLKDKDYKIYDFKINI